MIVVQAPKQVISAEEETVNRIVHLLNFGKNYSEAIRLCESLLKKSPQNKKYREYYALALLGRAASVGLAEKQSSALPSDKQKYERFLAQWSAEKNNPESYWFRREQPKAPVSRTWDDSRRHILSTAESKTLMDNHEVRGLELLEGLINEATDPAEKSRFLLLKAWTKFHYKSLRGRKTVEISGNNDFLADAELALSLSDTPENCEDIADLNFLCSNSAVYGSQQMLMNALASYKKAFTEKRNSNLDFKILTVLCQLPKISDTEHNFVRTCV